MVSDSPQEPPRRRRLNSDPLGLGDQTPSREVGFDPLGLGKPSPVDPLALANELLAQGEPPAPPPPAAPIYRPNPLPRLDPLGLSQEPVPPRLNLERAGETMTRKLPAVQPPTPAIQQPLPMEKAPERPELDLKALLAEEPTTRAGDWSLVSGKHIAIDPGKQSPVWARPTVAVNPGDPPKPFTLPRQEAVQAAPPPRARHGRKHERVISHGPAERLRRLVDRKQRVTSDDVVVFTRQFCAMVGSGLPLHQSLYFYAENEPDAALSRIVHDVADRVGEGNPISTGMRRYPEVFSEVYTGLIAAGESTGMLVAVLNKLADLSEKNQRIRKKVWSTLTYPLVLITVSTLCVLAFLYFVLPMLVPLFSTLGVQLPLPTRMLLQISYTMQSPLTLALVLATPVALFFLWPSTRGLREKRWVHRIPLELPLVGKMVEKIITARIMFSMATLLDAGFALTATLEKCEKVAGNAEIAYRLRRAREMLVEGASAAECLERARVFPNGAIQMIAVGEETAALAEMIARVAQVYEDDVELTLLDLASLLEPAILMVMGVIVGFIVLAAVLPTVQLLDKL